MKKLAIIGAGVSGLTVNRLLSDRYSVKIFERESVPGGLIRCKNVENSLFHICGGHVFNTKRQDVMSFFEQIFNLDKDFIKTERNSTVFFENGEVTHPEKHSMFVHRTSWVDGVPYPIENHVYMLKKELQDAFIVDVLKMQRSYHRRLPKNFEEFLRWNFGSTLYNIYFKPYNEKIWRTNLKKIPIDWLQGKLPMPSCAEMLYNNFNHIRENDFVHDKFWYEREGGSQYLADKLAENADIQYNTDVSLIERTKKGWKINGEDFDVVVFCGNIKDICNVLKIKEIEPFANDIEQLDWHGTTSVFCEIDRNPYSWIYLPSDKYLAHRIICTGNFSSTNNRMKRLSATVEFTDYVSQDEILANLSRMPLNPHYITHEYTKYTYPIQSGNTRAMISGLKDALAGLNFYMTGRFTDWEYYNMDAAMGAAKDMVERYGI